MKDMGPAGHCQICERLIMVDEKNIVAKHGYTRPGHGWLNGMCWGADFPPYEKAKDQLLAYRDHVESYRKRITDLLRDLLDGTTTELADQVIFLGHGLEEKKVRPLIGPTHENWPGTVRWYKRDYERSIASAVATLKHVDQRIADWKPDQPLGEKAKAGLPMVLRIKVGATYKFGDQKVEVLSKPHTVVSMGRRSYDGVKVRRENDGKEFITRARNLKPTR